jgi:hypothetical protein
LDVPAADVSNLSLSDHCHRLKASQRAPGRSQVPEAKPGAHQTLDASVVLLDNVIEKLDLAQPREAPDLGDFFHVGHGSRIGRVLVNRDGARIDRVHLAHGLAEEPPGRGGISLGRKQEVDRPATAVDCPI